MDVDEAYGRALAIIAEVEPRIAALHSEQDARFQLINRFLVEVLGWFHADILTEPHSPSGYADYLVKAGEAKCLIVEAKKTGQILLDTASDHLANYKISGPAIASALDGVKQAVGYSTDHGVDLAVLTTGVTWVVFITFPGNGKSYRDTKAIVFPGFSAIKENFAAFYDLLSRDGVSKKLYKVHFARVEGLDPSNFEPMNSVNRTEDLRMLSKTPLAEDLDPVFKEFFGVMSGDRDKDMLLHCFVETKESRNADVSLQKLVGNIAGRVDTLSTDTGAQLVDQIEAIIETQRGENVLIVGNKGAGKSTFVERFFKLVLSSEFRSKCLIIRVDFLPSTGEAASVPSWTADKVKQEIEAQLFENGVPTYDELQGLYFHEYQKWRDGQFKPLYESDKVAFKIKFGEFLDKQINADPHQYILRLLEDVVKNRKLLPCFIFDNTDHHPENFQEAVFQWSQSIRLQVPFSLVVLPITDRTIWKMSKHGPFQTHDSKLFYLPVPSTREVLEKRIEYLQRHAGRAQGSKQYFSDKGIRLSVENINAFAACTEEIFIKEDFIARRIGWLSNHDIRRGLVLSRKVITSPFLNIDELIASYLKRAAGNKFSISYRKFMQALVLEDYNNFQQGDNPFVINIFDTTSEFPTSPLLRLSILKLLIDKAGDGDALGAYAPLSQIALYFGSMGIAEEPLHSAISALLDFRLIEPFDASSQLLSADQRLAVTHSGRMHFEMALSDPIYTSQMAFSTALRSPSVVERLRALKKLKMANPEWAEVRRVFALYCFAQDRTFVRMPRDAMFEGQRMFRKDFRTAWVGGAPDGVDLDASLAAVPKHVERSHVRATLKWYDAVKGFGFLDAGVGQDVFLHASTVSRAGIEAVAEGDVFVCDVAPGKEGRPQAIHVHSWEPAAREPTDSAQLVAGEVLFYNAQKGFGFVRAAGFAEDIYISAGLLQQAGVSGLDQGSTVLMAVGDNIPGRGRAAKSLRLSQS